MGGGTNTRRGVHDTHFARVHRLRASADLSSLVRRKPLQSFIVHLRADGNAVSKATAERKPPHMLQFSIVFVRANAEGRIRVRVHVFVCECTFMCECERYAQELGVTRTQTYMYTDVEI